MGSYVSILKFVNNPISGENISLGLLVITDNEVFFKISNQKLGMAKKLNPMSITLLEFALGQLKNFLAHDIKDQSDKLIHFAKTLDSNFLERLSNYNNGIVQFSKPSFIKSEINGGSFNSYFEKFIGENQEVIEVSKEISPMKQKIEENLYRPLRDKIDVDYTLKMKSLPTQYFNFHFDGIGINGAMYAAKSVDMNLGKIGAIQKEISEYESIIERLNVFAKVKNINGNPHYYLIVDEYKGNSLSYIDLYSILKQGNMPYFKLISSKELNIVVDLINSKNARKFSKELEILTV